MRGFIYKHAALILLVFLTLLGGIRTEQITYNCGTIGSFSMEVETGAIFAAFQNKCFEFINSLAKEKKEPYNSECSCSDICKKNCPPKKKDNIMIV